jgi:hypothetical protein
MVERNGRGSIAQRQQDGPGLSTGEETQNGQVSSRVDEATIDVHFLKTGEGSIHGHALGDAAEIEAGPTRQRDRPPHRIKHNIPPTAAGPDNRHTGRQTRREGFERTPLLLGAEMGMKNTHAVRCER